MLEDFKILKAIALRLHRTSEDFMILQKTSPNFETKATDISFLLKVVSIAF